MSEPAQLKLTFGEHLEELRARVILSLLAVLAAFLLCFYFADQLMAWILAPVLDSLDELGYPPHLVVTEVQEKFVVHLKLAGVAGLMLASPVVLHQFWRFVAAGLYPAERRYLLTFAPVSLLSFVSGVVFFYFIVLPWGLKYLLAYGDPEGGGALIRPMIQVSSHLSFFLMLSLVMGLVFELPLVMLFFSAIGVLTWDQYAAKRRHAILANFIIAAVLTPPDVISQIMMAVPLCLLYEVGILVSRVGLVRALPASAPVPAPAEPAAEPAPPVPAPAEEASAPPDVPPAPASVSGGASAPPDVPPVSPPAEEGLVAAGTRFNPLALALLILPSVVIAAAVAAKHRVAPRRGDLGAGKHPSSHTYQRLLAGVDGAPAAPWEQLLEDKDSDPVVRLEALRALASRKPAGLPETLRRLMARDPDPALQIEAAFFLARSSEAEGLERLVALLETAAPRYAWLAHKKLEAATGARRALSAYPSSKEAAECARFWKARLAARKGGK